MQPTTALTGLQRGAGKSLAVLSAGLLLIGWLFNTPAGLLGKADAIGYAVCHRIDLRSFHLGDRQVPLCARCTGMYLGAILGLAFQAWRGPRQGGMPAKRVTAVLALLAALFAVDGLNSFLHLAPLDLLPAYLRLYEPSNTLRLFTGTGMGLVLAAAVYPAFNQTAWFDWKPQAALDGLRTLGFLLLLAAGLDLLVLTENPLLLYPLVIASAVGVLLLLTEVYSMALLILLKQENRFRKLSEMLLPLTGGFVMALLQIALLDIARYAFTGTWDGFHFG